MNRKLKQGSFFAHLAVSLLVSRAQALDTVGLYFDPSATQTEATLQVTDGTANIEVYLIAHDTSHELASFQLYVRFLQAAPELAWTYVQSWIAGQTDCINAIDFPKHGFAVGCRTAIAPSELVVLATMTFQFVATPRDFGLWLDLDPFWSMFAYGDGANQVTPFAPESIGASAVINPSGVASVATSFSRIKGLYAN